MTLNDLTPSPVDQSSANPTRKLAASGVSGSATVVLIYILSLLNVTLPAEVAAAAVVVLSFVAGYVRRDQQAA